MSLKEQWKNFWSLTRHFKQVENPVWNKFKTSNGILEGYYFIRFLLERGKHHPQIILSMMGEYALVMLALNFVGIKITTYAVLISMSIIIILILILGYLDVYLDVARRSNSYHARFSPEQQTLYKQVEDLEKRTKIILKEVLKNRKK